MWNESPVPHQRISGTVAVRTDVYPANVSFSFASNPYPRSRAIVTADTLIVLVEGGNGTGAAVLYEGRLEDVTFDRREATVVTEDGTITISRQGGCGCGSRLRSYRPFGRAVRMERVPA